jgi:hypothetical protein
MFEIVFGIVGFEVITAVVMNNSVIWNIMTYSPYISGRL